MKYIRRSIIPVLFCCYLITVILGSDFWGNILSPIIEFLSCLLVFKAFYLMQDKRLYRIVGLLLSLSIFSWVLSDILWAYYDLVLHINPDEIRIITYLYSLTNVFLTLSLSIFGFQIFRKWNILQILLDSMVMSYIILDLIWIVFLNEDVKKILALKSDWVSSASIMMDVLTTIWIIFWCMSIRTGKFPVFITLTAVGAILYSITDLVYYYEYLYSNYHPNSLLDAVYAFSFLLMAAAASIRISNHYKEGEISFHNTGRKGRAYILLVAPLLLIIFKGFIVVDLLQLVSVILIYSLLTSYVQNNIYKEGLLRKEKEHNSELEQKVKERTEELEESNRILQHLNNQDYITGLYNRRYLLTYLEETSKHLEREETIVLLYIDINRFKMMKTMYGHYIGEEILQELAIKIKPMKKLANKTILASYGDDTYIFAAVGPYNYWHGRGFAEEVVRLCSDIYHIDEYQIRITVNIGISIFPYDAITKEDLIKHADIAMSQARMQGFNMIHEFDLQLSSTFLRRSNIELMLKKADFGQEFMVYYQPQLQTDNRKIIGFEALLRWKTPFSEFISPAEFIPIAEETGCIIPIGEWVMKSVMKQLLDWNNYFDEKVMIGINVSLKQLSSAEFFEKLKEEVKELQIKPEWIDLEITESFQLQDNPDMIRMLEDIRNFGVKISVDDFGTGYSSLSYLKGLPIDRIKLARELIECIHTDDFDYQLVKSLIQLSKVKGIKVIAEGVETKEQWEILKELQCDEVQGYYFGRPAPVQEIEECYVRKPLDKSSVQFIRYFRSQ